ncbi:hypothetical protein H7J77_10920 [Mycolicibacillus parakoreensis]|uniref:Acyl-CoA:diacylglycerol acyltransferase n=2 Tax=Mycolicibacillus parakoreensis TaxID=1069221 RepID=A0ABY3TX85_9MYCO|nr:hypothetical protein [Mycolicibacillus parakoreensis]ULN52327.1 esterase family protein [Mycolicibacillus parakoreensis]
MDLLRRRCGSVAAPCDDAQVDSLTRRDMLRLGLGATAGLWSLGGLLGPATAHGAPPEPSAAGTVLPTRDSGSFVSAARAGKETNWIIARPPNQTGPLRPVIALHGMDSDAAEVMSLGIEEQLAKVVADGGSPFAVIAADGGNSFWHRRASGEDSGAMILDELLPLMATKGVDTSRVAFMGWSMGGYGALMLGSQLGPARTAGICAVSPAIYLTYWGAPPVAFDGIDDWRTNTVFGRPELNAIPLRVDCGIGDGFYVATRQFVNHLDTPPAGGFTPGGHDAAFWRSQLADELAWLAS